MRRSVRRPLCILSLLLLLAATAWAEAPPLIWQALTGEPDALGDEPLLTAVAPDGAVYAAGTTYQGGVGGWRENIILIRYEADGARAWIRSLATPGRDLPGALALDSAGNVILACVTAGDTARVEVVKHDADGGVIWHAKHDIVSTSNQGPAMAQGADGSLTLALQDDDLLHVLRLDASGTLLWSTPVTSPDANLPLSVAVAVDAFGATYAAGVYDSTTVFFQVVHTFKLDAAGAVQWSHAEDGNFNSFFEFIGVAVGPDGHPVVAANPESDCGLFEMRIWMLNAASGTPLWWNRLLDGNHCHVYKPVDLLLDAQGNAVVASYGRQGGSYEHIQVSRWSPTGDLLWFREFDGPGSSSDLTADLALDASGAAYVCGLTTNPPQDRDFAMVKYDPDGTQAWTLGWASPFGGNDWANAIAVGPAGQVAVVGTAYMGPTEGQQWVTLLFQEDVTSAAPPADPVAALMLRALGNPIDGPTDIRFALPQAGSYTLSVLDLRGREVRRIRQGSADAGEHLAVWNGRDDAGRPLPSGSYLLRLRTPRGEAVRSVAVVR